MFSSRDIFLLFFFIGLLAGCDNRQKTEKPTPSVAPQKTGAFSPSVSMKPIKPGQYVRVSSRRQQIAITRGFWIGVYEVTQQEYESVMGRNPSFFKGANLPVEKVSYLQALNYCRAITTDDRKAGRIPGDMAYRLPTEAEWEYACLAGVDTAFSFGDSPEAAEDHAWTTETAEDRTQPVGQKKPNLWGLYDMHGNVWEWCTDWFATHPVAGQLVDPVGPPNGEQKVFKGGSWYQETKFSRYTSRFVMKPDMSINYVGFRVVLSEL
jgi:formylglycine-generating enzyme required for sulfatase activity